MEFSILHVHKLVLYANSDGLFLIYNLGSGVGCSGWVDPNVGLSEFDVVCT